MELQEKEVAVMDCPKTRGRRLMDRDVALLKLLAEYGCVDAQRIKAKLWNGNPNSRVHFRRIGILRKMNLIDVVLGDQGAALGYRISKHGRNILSQKGQLTTAPVVRKTYKTQFEHDQILIDVRRILESSPVVQEFKTEAEVKNELLSGRRTPIDWKNAPTIPDATFMYEVPGQKCRVAIELELTQKSRARYFKIFRSHLLNKNWGLTFYIVRDEPLLIKMRALLNEVKTHDVHVRVARKINGVYFCNLNKFQADGLKTPFFNGKEEISLDQLAKNFGFI
jgi:hypothetical protein